VILVTLVTLAALFVHLHFSAKLLTRVTLVTLVTVKTF
jgi:hypothetical protein